MKIIVNASRVGNVGGLRSFAEAFIQCFERCREVTALVPSGVRIVTSLPQRFVPGWLASSGRTSVVRPILWWLYSVVESFRSRDALLVGTTHHVVPFRSRQMVTVHDLRPYYFPDTWVQSFYYRRMLPRGLKKCDGVLTVSETSKQCLVQVYGLRPERVHVIGNIVDSRYFCPGTAADSGDPYLLGVGASWKHKNMLELLEMNEYWATRYQLKIVAANGQYLEEMKRRAAELGLTERVQFLSGIDRQALRELYRGCSALVYPSWMEGFGLPPLEALACGRPVIVSDIALFREIFQSIPIYVKLGDRDSWKSSIASIDGIPESRLQAGIDLAATFSHEAMKRKLSDALEQAWKFELPLQ